VAQYVLSFASFFVQPALSNTDWLNLLNLVWPQIVAGRTQAATSARTFYDSQRLAAHPYLTRNERPLEGSEFPTFVRDMEPARAKMAQENSAPNATALFAARASREVENAGRQQTIHAVENDDGLIEVQKAQVAETAGRTDSVTKIIRGWARVATGSHPCAWCLMLVSRGPVYMDASTAGLDLDSYSAQKFIAAGQDVSDYMQEWHTNCHCIVVPVFKTKSWPGQAAADKALKLWNEATTEGDQLIESGDARTKNRNTEALNALRRRISRGEIDGSSYAGLAA
jgi:hypothetical protein